ncbi:phosphopantetheine-binding protein [Streptomyces sp. NPDC058655]|uniref:phosphopantetheine-binding protein n=1 Tax=Streptomyces sp. NPDC058655 TaxID=3346577 RepID=UPI00365520EB
MERDSVVGQIVARRSGRRVEELAPETDLSEDLGLDDAAVIGMLGELKAAGFHVRDGVDLGSLTTVQALMDAVSRTS